jgi:hypothetical protein
VSFLAGSRVTQRYQPEKGELSLYEGKLLDEQISAKLVLDIVTAFGYSQHKVKLLLELMANEQFTNERAIDAVKHVMKTHVAWGQEPPIGAFIQFDKKCKIFTIPQMNAVVHKGDYQPQDFAIVRIDGVSGCRSAAGKMPLFALKVDIVRFNLTARDPIYTGQEWPD